MNLMAKVDELKNKSKSGWKYVLPHCPNQQNGSIELIERTNFFGFRYIFLNSRFVLRQ